MVGELVIMKIAAVRSLQMARQIIQERLAMDPKLTMENFTIVKNGRWFEVFLKPVTRS